MLNVPVVDQTASSAPQYTAPGVAPVRNEAPQQQIAAGATAQQAGEQAMRTGATIGDRLNEQVDDARTKQAEAAALGAAQTVLTDPQNGYLNTRGQNAIDQYAPAKEAVVKGFQDQLDSLSNPIQKQMFQQVMNQHLLSIGQQMSSHNFQQTTQYSGEAAINRASTYALTAAAAASSYGQTDADGQATGDFAKNLKVAEQETLNGVQIMKGAPAGSDVANAALLNLHTQVGTTTLQTMMDARAPYSKVQATFDDMKSKGWLDLRVMDTLGKMVKTYSEQEITRTAVNQSLSDAVRASQGQPTTSTGTPDYTFPIKGATSTAQPYDPNEGGVSVSIPQGTSIQAPADGKVVQVGKNDDGEFTMGIQHADGSVTTFSGLNASNVRVGDTVQRGENIATSGAPSVLWSLADKNGNKVDPAKAGLPPVDLTKVTDEKVLNAALNGVRSQITDPYLQQQATSEMESIVRHNQQMENAAQTQIFKAAGDAFYSAGMNWRAIPPATFNQLTPEQQQKFKDEQTEHVLMQYNQSQAFRNMGETDLVSDFVTNPDQLTTDNVEAARAHLSNSTYLMLMRQAQELQTNPKGVIEAQGVNERIKYFAGNAGVNIEPKTPADKQAMIDLTYRVQQSIDQIKAQNHGKATADQVDKAIQQQLIQRTITTPRSAWNPLAFTGISPTSTENVRSFEMPPGATHVVPGSDGKMHYTDGTKDLGVVK